MAGLELYQRSYEASVQKDAQINMLKEHSTTWREYAQQAVQRKKQVKA